MSMGTYDKTGHVSQYAGNKSRKRTMWPLPGTSATDLLKTSYHVMVDLNLLKTSNFQCFYQEWTCNISPNNKKQIYVPLIVHGKP